ncbi:MAG: AMP-dependent synthetase/ligase [Candidatus Puniceispirillaceae bacterium]
MSQLTETNLISLFFNRSEQTPSKSLIWERTRKGWHSHSWSDIANQVLDCASALKNRGIGPGMRVAIISENRHEWVISDLAIMLIGAISVPLFTTQTTVDYSYLLKQSGARAAICSNAKIAYQVEPAAQAAPNCLLMVIMNPGRIFRASLNLAVVTWDDFLAEGKARPSVTKQASNAIGTNDIACIIYNSGATASPKGAMLTHKSIIANLIGVDNRLQDLKLSNERVLSILPLSHAYEHSVGLYYPIHILSEIYYLPRPELLSTAFLEVRPTIMTAVPRIFDILKDRLEAVFRQKGPLAALLFNRAVIPRQPTNFYQRTPLFALERLVLRALIATPVKQRLGGSLKAFISGGAALHPQVSQFFGALGVRLMQGYGLTEASPVVSVVSPRNIKPGSVGKPIAGTSVKITNEGELCVKGDIVMAGYWDDPAATRQTLKKGWLHTGDLASIDDHGEITILGVKRDMIVNSGGENISPLRVEQVLHAQYAIQQAVIFGDSRPYLVALLTPSDTILEQARAKASPTNWIKSQLQDAIETANANLSPPERIRHFLITERPLASEANCQTPTGEIIRRNVAELYRSRIDGLYHMRGKE